MPEPEGAVTRLLGAMRDGNVEAEAQLLDLLYAELTKLARRYMRHERPEHTLQPTALVNEAYVRLLGGQARIWDNRAHFLAHAAGAMRRILVDHARARDAEKRGRPYVKVSLDGIVDDADQPLHDVATRLAGKAAELMSVDAALTELAALDPRQARIVELRFVAGLTDREVAEALRLSERTVYREWRTARLWLRRRIDGDTVVYGG